MEKYGFVYIWYDLKHKRLKMTKKPSKKDIDNLISNAVAKI